MVATILVLWSGKIIFDNSKLVLSRPPAQVSPLTLVLNEVLQLFDFAEKPLASAILQKSRSLIVRHLGKAVFEQNRDFSKNQIFATLPPRQTRSKF